MNKPISVLYAGSPGFSAGVLRALLQVKSENFFVAGVLTNPPSAKGRGKNPDEPTPVALCAQEAGIPVFAPQTLNTQAREEIAALGCDMLVCFSYGRIFGPKFLDLFSRGAINVHHSLLPKYRGAIPVQQAILNCDAETGVTIQKIALKMDEGNILFQKTIALNGTETTESLLARLSEDAARILPHILDAAFISGALPAGEPQNNNAASYCVKLKKEDGLINWNQSARSIDAKIRAFTPWPGTFTVLGKERIYIHKALVCADAADCAELPPGAVLGKNAQGILVKTGDGILALEIIQRETKKALNWRDFLNGNKTFLTARFS